MRAKCNTCGEPATCVGAYDSMTEMAAACDRCCGHGCEDGICFALATEDEEVAVAAAEQRGADRERAAVVAWLRILQTANFQGGGEGSSRYLGLVVDRLERGDHIPRDGDAKEKP